MSELLAGGFYLTCQNHGCKIESRWTVLQWNVKFTNLIFFTIFLYALYRGTSSNKTTSVAGREEGQGEGCQ